MLDRTPRGDAPIKRGLGKGASVTRLKAGLHGREGGQKKKRGTKPSSQGGRMQDRAELYWRPPQVQTRLNYIIQFNPLVKALWSQGSQSGNPEGLSCT